MKMYKFYRVFLFLIVAGACTPRSQTAVVFSEANEEINFQEFKTYAWLPPEEVIEELAILSVEDELNKRGYQLDTEDPDFIVAVHIIHEHSGELVRTPLYSHYDYRGPGFYSGPFQNYYYGESITVPIVSGYGDEQMNYVEGTIVVDIIDREKMEIVWRGWAVDQRNNQLDILNDLPGYINDIFSRYPVQPH